MWLLSWAACFVPRWRRGCLCRLLRAAYCCGLAPNLLKRFSRPCSPFTTALDGARSRRLRSRTSGVCASPAAFYGSIRIATGAAATGCAFELGDVRTSFFVMREATRPKLEGYGLLPRHQRVAFCRLKTAANCCDASPPLRRQSARGSRKHRTSKSCTVIRHATATPQTAPHTLRRTQRERTPSQRQHLHAGREKRQRAAREPQHCP